MMVSIVRICRLTGANGFGLTRGSPAEANRVPKDPAGVLQTLKAVCVYALLLQRSGHAFDHAVLLLLGIVHPS